jgi:predicted acylesterase/phospholipase RssA
MIKHLVISGGGPSGLNTYGAIKYLSKNNFLDMNHIKTIYGVSIGAFLGVILSLKYDWDTLDDYFIKKPWNKVINFSPEIIFNAWETKGLVGDEFVKNGLESLLAAKELSIDITLKEFYEYSNIDIHMFAIDINHQPITLTDISYKTFPDLQLIKALYMTTAIPLLFKPVIIDDKCYIDGGFITNFPLDICLKDTNCDPSEVLSFKNHWSIDDSIISSTITQKSSILQYWIYLIKILLNQIKIDKEDIKIDNIVNCLIEDCSELNEWKDVLLNKQLREKLIKKGEQSAFLFKKYKLNMGNRLNNLNNDKLNMNVNITSSIEIQTNNENSNNKTNNSNEMDIENILEIVKSIHG